MQMTLSTSASVTNTWTCTDDGRDDDNDDGRDDDGRDNDTDDNDNDDDEGNAASALSAFCWLMRLISC